MNLTTETLSKIGELLATGFSHERVAQKADCSENAVRDYDVLVRKRWVVSDDGLGRPELRKYIVAHRHVDHNWDPIKFPNINPERARYDAGLTELVTGRDGFRIILYSIPRKLIDKKRQERPYFSRNFGDG